MRLTCCWECISMSCMPFKFANWSTCDVYGHWILWLAFPWAESTFCNSHCIRLANPKDSVVSYASHMKKHVPRKDQYTINIWYFVIYIIFYADTSLCIVDMWWTMLTFVWINGTNISEITDVVSWVEKFSFFSCIINKTKKKTSNKGIALLSAVSLYLTRSFLLHMIYFVRKFANGPLPLYIF